MDSKDDLAHCTKSHFGEIVRVLQNDSIYECTSDGWIVADSTTIENILAESSNSAPNGENNSAKSSSSTIKATSSDMAVKIINNVKQADKNPPVFISPQPILIVAFSNNYTSKFFPIRINIKRINRRISA